MKIANINMCMTMQKNLDGIFGKILGGKIIMIPIPKISEYNTLLITCLYTDPLKGRNNI